MDKTGILILTVVMLGVISFLVMYNFAGFGFKKSLIIAGGASAAMLIFDLIVFKMIKKNR